MLGVRINFLIAVTIFSFATGELFMEWEMSVPESVKQQVLRTHEIMEKEWAVSYIIATGCEFVAITYRVTGSGPTSYLRVFVKGVESGVFEIVHIENVEQSVLPEVTIEPNGNLSAVAVLVKKEKAWGVSVSLEMLSAQYTANHRLYAITLFGGPVINTNVYLEIQPWTYGTGRVRNVTVLKAYPTYNYRVNDVEALKDIKALVPQNGWKWQESRDPDIGSLLRPCVRGALKLLEKEINEKFGKLKETEYIFPQPGEKVFLRPVDFGVPVKLNFLVRWRERAGDRYQSGYYVKTSKNQYTIILSNSDNGASNKIQSEFTSRLGNKTNVGIYTNDLQNTSLSSDALFSLLKQKKIIGQTATTNETGFTLLGLYPSQDFVVVYEVMATTSWWQPHVGSMSGFMSWGGIWISVKAGGNSKPELTQFSDLIGYTFTAKSIVASAHVNQNGEVES